MKTYPTKHISCIVVAGFALLTTVLFPTWIYAVDWNNPSGGDFSGDENWDGGVAPGDSDSARFAIAGTYTVNFSKDEEVLSIVLPGGGSANASDVTFDLGGNTLKATDSGIGLNITSGDSDNLRILRLLNGTVDVNDLRIGNGSGSVATLEVGSGAELIIRGENTRVGNGGDALLKVVSGGVVSSYVGLVARQGSTAILQVDGEGSRVNMNPGGTRQNLRLGLSEANTRGEMYVTEGGKIEGINALEIALHNNTSGQVLIEGTGSLVEAQSVHVAGRAAGGGQAGGPVLMEVIDGGLLTSNSSFRVYEQGIVDIRGGKITAASSIWQAGSTLLLTLYETTDTPLAVTGNVDLQTAEDNGVNFNLSLADDFSGQAGDVYTVLSYGTLTGEFFGLSEGAVITVQDIQFELSYGSGEITLTMIPEPGATIGIVAAGLLFIMMRLKHRNPRLA